MTWTTAFLDDCSNPDAISVWKGIDCGTPLDDRVKWHQDGGPGGAPWRELTVFPGDSLGWSGIRCELSPNDRFRAPILIPEGTRARVSFDLMLDQSFAINTDEWGGVCQLKQCQPYANPCGNVPMFTLQGYGTLLRFQLADPKAITLTDRKLWAPPVPGTWTRVRIDGHFSQGPGAWTKVRVGQVDSDRIVAPNLLRACADYDRGGPAQILAGESIPAHFRLGPYTHADRGEQTIGVSAIRYERR